MAKRSALVVFAALSAAGLGSCDKGITPADTVARTTQSSEGCVTEPAAKLRAVFHYLHRLNESEIRSGNLAADRTRIDDVRKFAVQMVDEHASADQKLVDLARRERIDLASFPPTDPIHAAALRFVGDEDLADVAPPAFDAAYIASQAEIHTVALKVIDEGQRLAAGDLKALLDDAHDMSSQHRDHATLLMQDFHFGPRGIGGGPAHDTDTSGDSVRAKSDVSRRHRGMNEPTSSSRTSDDPLAMDGGTWPPATSPPDRMAEPR
jgi:predicted outer membrane protein